MKFFNWWPWCEVARKRRVEARYNADVVRALRHLYQSNINWVPYAEVLSSPLCVLDGIHSPAPKVYVVSTHHRFEHYLRANMRNGIRHVRVSPNGDALRGRRLGPFDRVVIEHSFSDLGPDFWQQLRVLEATRLSA